MDTDTKALRVLLDAGTPGEWELALSNESGRYISGHNGYVAIVHYWSRPEPEMQANAALIVALRNAARPLLDAADERDALLAEVARLRGDAGRYLALRDTADLFALMILDKAIPRENWDFAIDDALTGATK